ncbi:histidine ammonia-lyase [Equus asinus]|uniref:Histidine ammonia-lyase n=4 Tax=Equus TaxID=9789 RepID=A0A3Q2GU92_HORSE|nr:histidine ammonia-lyase isoform X1 [Equus caballus]XP_008514823.1 PREDICTED: histidine ammonia-lyase isoform X1 [Equus przewalskii]XP_014706195.1 histidine ammonia-lyase isoform X1 [Equus asinus]
MPRYTVHVRGEWLAVPCRDAQLTVGWLGREAVRRYIKNKPDNGGFASADDVRFLVRRCKGLGLLDNEDPLEVALEDNEFVEVVIEGDAMSPDFIPSQPEGVYLYSKYREPEKYIALDGDSLTTEDLVNLGNGHYKIKLTPTAEKKVQKSREVIDSIVRENTVVYGITTGFGKFARTVIPINKLEELQVNLVRSHSSGVGKPLIPERCRMLLALRINVLAKGYSGISLETLKQVIEVFNASCLPYVPEKGTVGASGDLAPLSHLALGLIGEGKMWSPKSGWADAKYVLEAHGLKPVVLKPKEGLALINGTQMITSLGCEAVERASAIARQADIVAALTLEVLKGTTKAFDTDIHAVRPHPGQIEVAFRFRSLLDSDHHPSEIAESHRFCDRVQDAYTLRCCPQIHGVVNDTIAFVKNIITTEINSATDNPMVFANRGETISGGNFHGEYPAKALDYLAIGVHELAAISERRIERLCNPSLSELPAFLVAEGGLNSGFMIAHCTAAALVSENKALCHPSSVDSLSTSAATEDHVSMGGWAARKALRVIEHVEQVLAIELLAACQGIEFLRPLKTTTPLEKVYDLVRSVVRPWIKDRFMAPDIEAVHRLLTEQKVWEVAVPYIEKYRMEHIPESRPVSPTAFSLESLHKNSIKIPESEDL